MRTAVIGTDRSDEKCVVTPTVDDHRDTEHQFTRQGREITARVVAIGVDQGHVLVFGDGAELEDCLVRIHSRCLYGDALRSDDCDCGPELDLAMDMIQDEGRGVLIYLEQEGRGAGLVNKARAYQYGQTNNADTFDSYRELGLPLDSRRYTAAAQALRGLGIKKIRLLTNNPDKARDLSRAGLRVQMISLLTPPQNPRVDRYLAAKRAHRGHRLPASWRSYRWADRMMRTGALLAFGLSCGALAAGLRNLVLTVWERLSPNAVVPAGAFVITGVGVAAMLGLLVGQRGSARWRVRKARLASRFAFLQLR
ncbi:GTP cyclohydrolase II [Nocardia tengchongensis]|uniref:GTP cyclohydrolase II n=1 Tax=Nocardia tengchongensis TaxID=2055889 RepID=UPI0036B62717